MIFNLVISIRTNVPWFIPDMSKCEDYCHTLLRTDELDYPFVYCRKKIKLMNKPSHVKTDQHKEKSRRTSTGNELKYNSLTEE